MLYSLSPWLLTPSTAGPFNPRLSRDPLNLRQSKQSLGKNCCWLSYGRLLSFPNLAFPKGNSGFSPKILSSSLSLPHFYNWHHCSFSGSSPNLELLLILFSLTSHLVSPSMAPFKVCLEEIYFSPPPLSPFLATTSDQFLLPTHLLPYNPLSQMTP